MPSRNPKTLTALEGQELVDFIRDTVTRLHEIADYLETYVGQELEQPDVAFDTPLVSTGEGNDAISPPA